MMVIQTPLWPIEGKGLLKGSTDLISVTYSRMRLTTLQNSLFFLQMKLKEEDFFTWIILVKTSAVIRLNFISMCL